MKRIHIVMAVVFALACGDSTGLDDSFPAVAGTYDYSADVIGIPAAFFNGTITIIDESRKTDAFSGSFDVTVGGGGVTPLRLTGAILAGRVTRDGDVLFQLGDPDYAHNGSIAGGRITGSWILTGSSASYAGSFTAIRR